MINGVNMLFTTILRTFFACGAVIVDGLKDANVVQIPVYKICVQYHLSFIYADVGFG